MVTETTALKIHKAVRTHFKGGIKSSNKQYIQTNEKSETRNKNQKIAEGKIHTYREGLKTGGGSRDGSLTKWERAKNIYSLGSGGSSYGNCTEMALLACYFAALEKIQYAIMCGFSSSVSDHAFCVVGLEGNPPWNNVTDMNSWDNTTAWVIDPWANICCNPQAYQVSFHQKLRYWKDKGKQIAAAGQWIEDQCSDEYIAKFNREKLTIGGVYIYDKIKDQLPI
jgi:hypothetical protein